MIFINGIFPNFEIRRPFLRLDPIFVAQAPCQSKNYIFFPSIFFLVKNLPNQTNQRRNSRSELILTCCWISFTTNFTTERSCPFMNWHFVHSQLLFSIKISLANFTFEWPKFFMHTLNRNHLRFEFQLPHSNLSLIILN